MLLVKTFLDKSAIHDIDLFAAEGIRKGTVVWKFNPLVDSKGLACARQLLQLLASKACFSVCASSRL